MLGFVKTKWFKYVKNLIIGLGASVVLIGALAKLESWPNASLFLMVGLGVEAFIFFFLGVIGPEPDYYWHKLYPGLDDYHSKIQPLTAGEGPAGINGEVVEQQLGGMLTELQSMSKSLGSLKALQEVDFNQTSDQMKSMNSFYQRINEAMANLSDTLEDTAVYREQIGTLTSNLGNLNQFYGNMLDNASGINESMSSINEGLSDSQRFADQVSGLNKNLESLNRVYGNMLSAMSMGGQNS